MARLPDPIIEELRADWDNEYEARGKTFFSVLGVSVRTANREMLKKSELEKKIEKDKKDQ